MVRRRRFGSVHILCNNAGTVLGVPNAVHTYDEDAWLKTIDVNLHGVYRVSKAIVPLMMSTRCLTVLTQWLKPASSC